MRTLLHLSDVHFGPKHLEERSAAILELARGRRPDYVVISGDLTQRAKPAQFAAARRFVESLAVPSLAVPGNHDVPLYRVWERALVPFWAWRRHFSTELEPELGDDEVVIVGVNSAFNVTFTGGRITAAQRRRLHERFSASPAGACRVAVIHHNLVRPHGLEEVPAPLRGSSRTLEALVAAGTDLVLTGHLHQSYLAALGRGGVILSTGTTTSSRGRGHETGSGSCHWIEIDRTEVGVDFLRWDPASGRFAATGRRTFARGAAGEGVAAGGERGP